MEVVQKFLVENIAWGFGSFIALIVWFLKLEGKTLKNEKEILNIDLQVNKKKQCYDSKITKLESKINSMDNKITEDKIQLATMKTILKRVEVDFKELSVQNNKELEEIKSMLKTYLIKKQK